MIITSEVAPSYLLAPFVRCYSYREFDTKGMDMTKPWHAAHEMTLVFFFQAKPIKLVDPHTNQIIQRGTYCDITGLATKYLGMATFNGVYSFFEICFRPNGFYRIFGISPKEITDHIIAAEDVLDRTFMYLFERLCAAKYLTERAALADAYLLNILKEQNQVYYKDGITAISDVILRSIQPINVRQLAYSANMSPRNFERHFLEEVGMPPKYFCCVARFNHAFEAKLKYPQKDWTSIAHEWGYFDQMHLIKDFKRFSGNPPASFLKQTPYAEQDYISRL